MPRARISTTVTVGEIPGRVILQIRIRREAPSISAASYRVGSMPAMAARKIMVHQPVSFHMAVITANGRNSAGEVRNCSLTPKRLFSRSLTAPVLVSRT